MKHSKDIVQNNKDIINLKYSDNDEKNENQQSDD